MVFVEIVGGGETGIGYTYADTATARVVREELSELLEGSDALETGERFAEMESRIRNLGREGITAMALSAVDIALWDLRQSPLSTYRFVRCLAPRERERPSTGSGGFTSYSVKRLRDQLAGWVQGGIPRVKMKIGRDPSVDLERVAQARDAIGDAELFVDANGAYSRKQALQFAHEFAALRVKWFEEPVYHHDLRGSLSGARSRAGGYGDCCRRVLLRGV